MSRVILHRPTTNKAFKTIYDTFEKNQSTGLVVTPIFINFADE
jgi:hypothetical protein